MKKMLVKAVALSLVLGGVGFVANNAQASNPFEDAKYKGMVEANHARSMQNQKDIATNKAIATKAYGMA